MTEDARGRRRIKKIVRIEEEGSGTKNGMEYGRGSRKRGEWTRMDEKEERKGGQKRTEVEDGGGYNGVI